MQKEIAAGTTMAQRWDPRRLFETAMFYDALPGAATVRQWGDQIRSWIGIKEVEPMINEQPSILLVGLAPDLGIPLVAYFQGQGWQVYGWGTEAWAQAAGIPVLSLPELQQRGLAGISAVISGRDDGIPEVQELITWVSHFWQDLPERMIFDFRLPTESLKSLWGSVDDVVMGGVSESHLQLLPETGLFAGTVSTANSGGFASIRTRSMEPPLDLKGYQGLVLRVMGDGKRYKLFVRTDAGWDSLAYSHSFDTVPGQWLTIESPFASMIPTFRAKTIADAPPLDPSRIRSLQVMLSRFEQDKQLNPLFSPGPFGLQLGYIGAYGGIPMPQWIIVSNQDPALEQDPIQSLQSTGIRYQIVSPSSAGWPTQVGSLVGCETPLEAMS